MCFNLDIRGMHIALFLLIRISGKVYFISHWVLMNVVMCLGTLACGCRDTTEWLSGRASCLSTWLWAICVTLLQHNAVTTITTCCTIHSEVVLQSAIVMQPVHSQVVLQYLCVHLCPPCNICLVATHLLLPGHIAIPLCLPLSALQHLFGCNLSTRHASLQHSSYCCNLSLTCSVATLLIPTCISALHVSLQCSKICIPMPNATFIQRYVYIVLIWRQATCGMYLLGVHKCWMCVWCWACVNGCWACVRGAGHVCVVLGRVGALPRQAMLSLSLLCCGHVTIIIIVMALWQWPQVSCCCCCCCGVTMWPSSLLLWHCGSGHRHHVIVVVALVWPCHHHCRCHHCGVAMLPSPLSSWCCGSGHRRHIIVVAVAWPCCCHHCSMVMSSSSVVLWWDSDGGGLTVVVSVHCHHCCHHLSSLWHWPQALLSRTKHVWYSEHGMYCWFEIILERAMSVTHVAVIPHMRTHSDEEEFPKKWLSWRE